MVTFLIILALTATVTFAIPGRRRRWRQRLHDDGNDTWTGVDDDIDLGHHDLHLGGHHDCSSSVDHSHGCDIDLGGHGHDLRRCRHGDHH